MRYEVELKFPIDSPDATVAKILDLGATQGDTHRQTDVYFNHPARDFGETDEAFRIRTTNDRHRVTYKGPLVDDLTKTRREIELPFGDTPDAGAQFAEILRNLSFRETGTVDKTRHFYHLTWHELDVEVCIDAVEGLGSFIELETVTDETGLDAARASLLQLADELGLANSERRSYLVLLMEKDRQS